VLLSSPDTEADEQNSERVATDADADADQAVLEAAHALGEELAVARTESTPFQFNSILMQCNEAISRETGIQYGDACGAGGSC